MDRHAKLFEATVFHRQADAAGDALHAGLDGNIGIAEGESFEQMPVAAHQVEQHGVAIAVEDDVAVTGSLDGDGLLFGAVGSEVVGAVPRRTAAGGVARLYLVAVAVAVVFLVETCMHQKRVAGLHARRRCTAPVAAECCGVISRQQTVIGRLLLRAGMPRRVHMQDAATGRGHRFGARAHLHDALGLPGNAVRIAQYEACFIARVWLQIEHTAGEHVGRRVVQHRRIQRALVLQPQRRQALTPVAVAGFAVVQRHTGVAVVVALDQPFEAQRQQGGGFYYQFASGDGCSRFRSVATAGQGGQ